MSAPEYGRSYWIALPVGGALMAVGIIGIIAGKGVATSLDIGAWLVGADVAHDFVLAPLACLIGAVVARALPRWCRAPVQAAVLVTGVLLIVVFPALRGYGHDRVPDNQSVQPLDYTTATLTALVVVWTGAAAWSAVRLASAVRGRRRPRSRAIPGDRPTSRR